MVVYGGGPFNASVGRLLSEVRYDWSGSQSRRPRSATLDRKPLFEGSEHGRMSAVSLVDENRIRR